MRPGFAFSTAFRVRYAEIDGQKVVSTRATSNADAAVSEYWAWTGIGKALGQTWQEAEFYVGQTEIECLRPFVLGDTVEASVRIDALGRTSMTERFELAHVDTGVLHAVVTMTIVNVHLPTERPAPIEGEMRAFLTALMVAQPDRVA